MSSSRPRRPSETSSSPSEPQVLATFRPSCKLGNHAGQPLGPSVGPESAAGTSTALVVWDTIDQRPKLALRSSTAQARLPTAPSRRPIRSDPNPTLLESEASVLLLHPIVPFAGRCSPSSLAPLCCVFHADVRSFVSVFDCHRAHCVSGDRSRVRVVPAVLVRGHASARLFCQDHRRTAPFLLYAS